MSQVLATAWPTRYSQDARLGQCREPGSDNQGRNVKPALATHDGMLQRTLIVVPSHFLNQVDSRRSEGEQ